MSLPPVGASMSMTDFRPTAAFFTTLPIQGTDALLRLDKETLGLFKSFTGIEDQEMLKAHIVAVQREAYAVGRPKVLSPMILD